jgi:hypothetical protein
MGRSPGRRTRRGTAIDGRLERPTVPGSAAGVDLDLASIPGSGFE